MKCLFTIMALLSLVLSSCTTVTKGFQENALQEPDAIKGATKIPIRVIGGNEKSLREFLTHALLAAHPDDAVYIGSKPKDLPYDLPIPENARIVGCVKGQWMDYRLYFETGLAQDLVLKLYAKSLADRGWHAVPQYLEQPAGFISETQPATPSYDRFCNKDNSAFLSLETPLISNKKTSIQLSLKIDPDIQMCESDFRQECFGSNNLIPTLHSPTDTTVDSRGTGSGTTEADAEARLITKMPVAKIVEHYNQQLVSSGWKLQNSDHGKGAAWSNWKFKDEKKKNWMGTLMVIRISKEKNMYQAMLKVERV